MSTAEILEEVITFAIEREQEAQKTYEAAARMVKDVTMRDALLEMAEQERGHERKLRNLDVKRFIARAAQPVPSLNIDDYVTPGEFHPDMSYPELLTLAMQREKAAFRLYTDLARVVTDPTARELFLALAQEEARHKLAFEIEYDQQVMQEN